MRKCGFILLFLGCIIGFLHAQAPRIAAGDSTNQRPRIYFGVEIWDAVHHGATLIVTFKTKGKLEVTAAVGFNFWRHYHMLGTVADQVFGPYGFVGVQRRFVHAQPWAWLLGGRLALGLFDHRAVATIPNYYGDIVQQFHFKTGYISPQMIVARSGEWRRWRLDAGLRISICPRQFAEIASGTYQPGIGRAGIWTQKRTTSWSLVPYPYVALSFALD